MLLGGCDYLPIGDSLVCLFSLVQNSNSKDMFSHTLLLYRGGIDQAIAPYHVDRLSEVTLRGQMILNPSARRQTIVTDVTPKLTIR